MLEGLKGIDEGAGAVVDGEKEGGAVVAGGRAGFLTDDEETCGVGGAILDGFADNGETVEFGGEWASDGGGSL